jgi:hypothetical protein
MEVLPLVRNLFEDEDAVPVVRPNKTVKYGPMVARS